MAIVDDSPVVNRLATAIEKACINNDKKAHIGRDEEGHNDKDDEAAEDKEHSFVKPKACNYSTYDKHVDLAVDNKEPN